VLNVCEVWFLTSGSNTVYAYLRTGSLGEYFGPKGMRKGVEKHQNKELI
jgi:hypothetical protein